MENYFQSRGPRASDPRGVEVAQKAALSAAAAVDPTGKVLQRFSVQPESATEILTRLEQRLRQYSTVEPPVAEKPTAPKRQTTRETKAPTRAAPSLKTSPLNIKDTFRATMRAETAWNNSVRNNSPSKYRSSSEYNKSDFNGTRVSPPQKQSMRQPTFVLSRR